MAIVSENIINLLNYRIEQEELSSRLYLSMSIWLNISGYAGASALWKKYSDEELIHADWARKYLLDLNIKPNVATIQAPQTDFKGLPQIVALSYKHEESITKQCQDLAGVCNLEGDFMTMTLAQKYLAEQIDEIKKLTDIASMIEAFGTDKIALRLLDNELTKL